MEQQTALSILKTGRNVYLTGAAGSGKTYVLNQYIEYLRNHNVHVGITASTGIAATHIGGMTIHSWSGIGVKDYLSEWDIDALTQRQPLAKRYEKTDVLIIDEISMLQPTQLDMVDAIAREMKRSEEPFGGMQVVLCGDFFQLPPVSRGNDTDVFADSARVWREADFKICYLTEQHRQQNDPLLSILNDIRDGELQEASLEALQSRVVEGSDHDGLEEAVVLHTHNAHVDERNYEELGKLAADSVEYEMVATGRANLKEALQKSVLAPQTLELKEGARVMFVKNNPEQDYVNGTLGEVVDLSGAYPLVRTNDGRDIVAHPVSWEMIDDGKVLASVSQVPLRLAWAITVHKSQGMSLDAAEVDLTRAFTPGQGYVALSRVRTLAGLFLRGFNRMALEVHPYVQMRDAQLQEDAARLEKQFTRFSPEKIAQMHEEFISGVAHAEPEPVASKVPTHLLTRAELELGKTLTEISEARSLTVGTIISHLEKLAAAGDSEIFAHLQPDEKTCSVIADAFAKTKGDALSPVHRRLKGKYSFEELRLARLFIDEI